MPKNLIPTAIPTKLFVNLCNGMKLSAFSKDAPEHYGRRSGLGQNKWIFREQPNTAAPGTGQRLTVPDSCG